MKYDAYSTSSDQTGAGSEAQRAVGKQTLTERLVQRKARGAAPGAPEAPATAPAGLDTAATADDPFALHLPEVVQQDGGGGGDPGLVRSAAAEGVRGAGGPMPFAAEIQASFGRAADVSQIQAHVGGPAAEACEAMDASAYATGDRVAFASSPDLHTAAHEAAHVVQQAHGVNLYGGVGAAGDAYEQHADQVADRVVAGQSAEALLEDGPRAGGGGGGGGGGEGEGGAADEVAEDAELEAELEAEGPVQLRRRRGGGGGGLAGKAQMLLQWRREMVDVARQVAGEFRPLGLTFRPQILLATAMQEAAPSNALTARSFDNGLGLMQITPYRGRLDPQVARAIGWDNSRGLAANIASSNWRNARANLLAGAYTMLTKARAIKRALPRVWEQMDEEHKWRAVLFAYNAGEGSAISALRRGGPNARMISTYTNPRGQRVSHDYTAEIAEKMDWVESHDPFGGEGGGRTPTADRDDAAGDDDAGGGGGGAGVGGERRGGPDDDRDDAGGGSGARIGASVGRGGRNRRADVRIVQSNLRRHGYHQVGRVDGVVGPKTRGAIEDFQEAVLGFADGLIEVGRNTFDALFGDDPSPAGSRGGRGGTGGGGGATRRPARRPDAGGDVETTGRHAPDGDEERDGRDRQGDDSPDPPSYQAISQGNFRGTIPGSNLTWHQALWLPSFSRHVRPSDVTNIGMDDLLANVARQAAALTAVASALGTSIVVHCWVRPPAYNRRIGGASNSAHLRGTATDFHCPGMTAEQVRRAVKSRQLYPGAGENNVSWVHLDLEHQRWFNP